MHLYSNSNHSIFIKAVVLCLLITMNPCILLFGQQHYSNNSSVYDSQGNRPRAYSSGILKSISNNKSTEKSRTSWSSSGPYGGDIYKIKVSSLDENILFAAGGIPYISTDGGSSWEIMENLSEMSSNHVNVFETGPSGLVYAGGEQNYGIIFKSLDNGENWSALELPNNAYPLSITVDQSNPERVFVGIPGVFGATESEAIVRTTNGGLSWTILNTDVLDPSYVISEIAIDQQNGDVIFASAQGGMSGGSVIASFDGGDSWQAKNSALPLSYVFNSITISNNKVYMGGGQLFGSQYAGLWVSDDMGDSWTKLSAAFPLEVVNVVRVCPDDAEKIYAGTEGDGVYFSNDGGNTWIYSTSGADNFAVRDICFLPSNPQTIYSSSLSMAVFKSDDGAYSWNSARQGIASLYLNDIAVSPNDPNIRIASFEAENSGGCFLSLDGYSWQEASGLPGTRFTAVGISIDNKMYAWSNGPTSIAPEGLYMSEDNGGNWVNLGPDVGPNFETEVTALELSATDPSRLIVGGNNFGNNGWAAVIHHSKNGGESWNNIYVGPDYNSVKCLTISPQNEDYVYASFDSQNSQAGFLKSVNGGLDWTICNSGLPAGIKYAPSLTVSPMNPALIYLAAGANNIPWDVYRSPDYGDSWIGVYMNEDVRITSLQCSPLMHEVVYAATYENGVLLTIDGGLSWVYQNQGLPPGIHINRLSKININEGLPEIYAASAQNSSWYSSVITPEFGILNGYIRIKSSQEPITGAELLLDGQIFDYNLVSNDDGYFFLNGILAGEYRLLFSKEGYNTIDTNVFVYPEPNPELLLELTAPVLSIDETSLWAMIPPDYQDALSFTVYNQGDGPLEWHTSVEYEEDIIEVLETSTINGLPSGTYPSGVAFDGEYLWITATAENSGGEHFICKLDKDANVLESWPQNISEWGIRSICFYDGFIYGGAHDGFYKINTLTGNLERLFDHTFELDQFRGVEFIPPLNAFAATDIFEDMILFDIDGNLLDTYSMSGHPMINDLCYDPAGNCLWMFERMGSPASCMKKYDYNNREFTGEIIQLPLLEGLSSQIAGGLFFSNNFLENEHCLCGITNSAEPEDKFFSLRIYPEWFSFNQYQGVIQAGSSSEIVVELRTFGYELNDILLSYFDICSQNPDVGKVNMEIVLDVNYIGIGENKKSIEVMPNPASGPVKIVSGLKGPLKVYSLGGILFKVFEENKGNTNILEWDFRLDNGDILPDGIYLIRDDNTKSSVKIVKTK